MKNMEEFKGESQDHAGTSEGDGVDVSAKGADTKKIIVFLTVKGGAGRTSCLSNVAWLLARQGKRVLVVDGDVEAPGLSVMNSFQPIEQVDLPDTVVSEPKLQTTFEMGAGLLAVAGLSEKSAGAPLGKFIHPVILKNPNKNAPTNILMNPYFKKKLQSNNRLVFAEDGNSYTVDEDFWHPKGELWVLPVGETDTDASVFTSYRNRGVKDHVISYLHDFLRELVSTKGEDRSGAPIFDYVLVDTRAGFDKWTIDILLPTAGQIAMVAHFNQQGRRESNKLLYNIRTLGFYESTKDEVKPHSPLELIPNDSIQAMSINGKRQDIWTIPIHFYSQILPPGENYLRNEVFHNYLLVMKEGYDVSLGRAQSEKVLHPIPHFFTERSDITQIFYNSSLPLDEDIVSIDADPQNYTSIPYWKFTDSLLQEYGEDVRSKTRDLMDCYDACVTHDDPFFEEIPITESQNFKTPSYENIERYISIIKDLSYQEPQTAQNHVELLLSQYGLMLRLLASKHPKVQVICTEFFRVAATLPSEYTRSSLLQSIALLMSRAGKAELDWIKDSRIAKMKRLGGDNDLEGTVAGIEVGAKSVHVATRYLNYDTDPEFKQVVQENLNRGIPYTYYLDTTNFVSTSSWESYYRDLIGLRDSGKLDFDENSKSQFHHDGLPKKLMVKELIAREKYDLVFYESENEGVMAPLSCVLFPATPPTEEEKDADLFIVTDHSAILSSVQTLLHKCSAI